jgi:hypothetical protein
MTQSIRNRSSGGLAITIPADHSDQSPFGAL